MTEPGTRVGAMSHADLTTVYMFGWGVYEGDFTRPNYVPYDAHLLAAEIRQSDEELPPRMRREIRRSMLLDEKTDAEIEEELRKFNERIEANRQVPMQERVALLQEKLGLNPRIKLDDGRGTVWGFQCWWGPEERVREKIADRKIVLVDLPEAE